MTVTFVKRYGKLVPAHSDDVKTLESIKARLAEGQSVDMHVGKERSTQAHMMYWKCLQLVLDNSEKYGAVYKDAGALHMALKYGFCTVNPDYFNVVKTLDGTEVKCVFSESFYDMPQHRVHPYYQWAYETMSEMIGVDVTTLQGEATNA